MFSNIFGDEVKSSNICGTEADEIRKYGIVELNTRFIFPSKVFVLINEFSPILIILIFVSPCSFDKRTSEDDVISNVALIVPSIRFIFTVEFLKSPLIKLFFPVRLRFPKVSDIWQVAVLVEIFILSKRKGIFII